MMYRLVAINLDRIADPGNYRTMLPATSLRSLPFKGILTAKTQRAQRKTINPDLSGAT
jgi:hypothetical protein